MSCRTAIRMVQPQKRSRCRRAAIGNCHESSSDFVMGMIGFMVLLQRSRGNSTLLLLLPSIVAIHLGSIPDALGYILKRIDKQPNPVLVAILQASARDTSSTIGLLFQMIDSTRTDVKPKRMRLHRRC